MSDQPTLTHDGGTVCEHGVDITVFECRYCGNTPTDTISTRGAVRMQWGNMTRMFTDEEQAVLVRALLSYRSASVEDIPVIDRILRDGWVER